MTEDEALEVLRTHRRRLLGQRCLVCVTTLGLVVLGGWLSTPASWGGNQGPWPIGWALTVAVSIVLIAIVARPTLVSGSRCPQVTTLAPAVVVCSGAGRIAVRPAASSASEGEGDAPARLAWQAISERELPEPGRRVWISATPARGVQSPVVVPPSAGPGRRDGLPATPASPVGSTPGGEERSRLASAYVVWPRDTMEEEGPTRFVVPPADEPGAQPGAGAPADVLAAARRAGRTALVTLCVFLGLPAIGWIAVSLWALSGDGDPPLTLLTNSVVIASLFIQWGLPRFAPAWAMWRATDLRRGILADRTTRATFSPVPTLVLLLGRPASQHPDDAGSADAAAGARRGDRSDVPQVWGWAPLTWTPLKRRPDELWIADTARPGRLAAASEFGGAESGRLLYPSSRVSRVEDAELVVTDSAPA